MQGVYLITGGLGNIGLLLADYLARTVQARLALLGRSTFPERHTWDDYLATHDAYDPVSAKIESIRKLEAAGAEVAILEANVADSTRLQQAVAQVQARFGAMHGVIHAAGIAGEKTVRLLPEIDRTECERHFEAKVRGTYSLQRALEGRDYDFVLLFSSNVSVLGGLGSTAYAAANLFMDAFVTSAHVAGERWISANWDGWLSDESSALSTSLQTSIDQYAMQPTESVEAFRRLVTTTTSEQVVVSTGHLPTRMDLWINRLTGDDTDEPTRYPRPDLGTEYAPPENEVQKRIVTIWQELLGIDELGIHDNFFDLGGNSLIGLKVLSRLKKELGIEIPVVSLFEGPTAAALAQVIDQSENGQVSYQSSVDRGARRRERHRRR
jgi:NAD(P)-dependent dehydrogenase (short-subunit alcohol dehydrogenase family)/acyl carrier protein